MATDGPRVGPNVAANQRYRDKYRRAKLEKPAPLEQPPLRSTDYIQVET